MLLGVVCGSSGGPRRPGIPEEEGVLGELTEQQPLRHEDEPRVPRPRGLEPHLRVRAEGRDAALRTITVIKTSHILPSGQ